MYTEIHENVGELALPPWAMQPMQPTLTNLSYLLRHRELWPKGFVWGFMSPHTCAMGLANETWGGMAEGGNYFTESAKMFAISERRAMRLFVMAPKTWSGGLIRPEDVANTIDKYLAKRGRWAWLRRLFRR